MCSDRVNVLVRDRVVQQPETSTAVVAGILALASAATVGAAWWLQWRGYVPCELCLKERIPYYATVPIAVLLAGVPLSPQRRRLGFAMLAVLFVAGAVLSVYHTGVEAKLWAGPTACSGAMTAPAAVGDFLKQLNTISVVRCDEAALKVLGLSLAAWNAIVAFGLAVVSLIGYRRV